MNTLPSNMSCNDFNFNNNNTKEEIKNIAKFISRDNPLDGNNVNSIFSKIECVDNNPPSPPTTSSYGTT